ncbi:3-keto-5-aminohexanoate cleavage protein [Neotabrizicola sp. VNH66]|uniref:3-keto-5-aminohexanoate cleavage protein n=1 Tax=Neotabrizicola sp. VNH66 TaxID=3400918 RepID=UPI003C057220
MTPLPRLMVAPNGARRGRVDHPALPLTVEQVVETAAACHAAGADGLHAHVRDGSGAHVLDAGLYRELLAGMAQHVPGMAVQITTEAVGRYTAAQQRALVRALRPAAVSIAIGEILDDGDTADTARLFAECAEAGTAVQHILYSADEVAVLARLVADGTVPRHGLQVLHVLGRYATGQLSAAADMDAPLARARSVGLVADWAVCAFGPQETACLTEAARRGGKARVGFENNIYMADGRIARDNAERVAEVAAALSLLQAS